MSGNKNIVATVGVDLDLSRLVRGAEAAEQRLKKLESELVKATNDMANGNEKAASRIAQINKRIAATEKQLTTILKAEARERASIARQAENASGTKQIQKNEAARRATIRQRGKTDVDTTAGQSAARAEESEFREAQKRRTMVYQRNTNEMTARLRDWVNNNEEQYKRDTAQFRDQLSFRREMFRKNVKEMGTMSVQLQNAINASISRNNAAYSMGMQAQATGMTPSQVWQQRMNAATARGNAANAVALTQPWQQQAAGGGRGGRGNILTRMLGMGGGGMAGGLISSLAGGFGIGVGGYALAGGINALTENAERATAYERQSLAAERLAGSQERLNALIAEYEESSGGAVDASTALANVTRLLATGYADSVPEVEKFVKATRGASIALGKPQDYVIQETQLAMSNTSFKRLDQIGLGIEEVQERIRALREENAGMTRETAFQVAVLDAMNEKYGQLADSAEGQATGIEKLRKEWQNLGLAVGQAIEEPLSDLAQFIADQLDKASELIDKAHQVGEDKEAWRLENEVKGRRGPVVDPYFQIDEDWNIIMRRRSEGRAFGGEPAHMADTHAAALALPPPQSSRTLNEERDAIKADYFDKMAELERRTGEQRVQLIEQYESQRADIIRNYAKSVAREEEDFARSRARSLRDYERSILDMMEDAAEREADAQEELDEGIAEMREDANEKLADSEEKYQKDREKREEDHRDKLLKAAGQLDAISILEERKRWKRENEEAEEAHAEQRKELEESLSEQIEDAREAHAEQLQEAREADAERLQDMRENRARQLADEAEDRGIRLARQAEDHNDQLEEMDRQHALRLSQLATQAAAERLLLEEEFAEALNETGMFIEGMTEKMLARDKLIEDWFDGFIDMIEARLLVQSDPGRYAYDPETGPRIPLDYGSQLGYTPTPSYSASGTGVTRDGDFSRFGGGGNTITFQNGAIRVTTTEGFEERVADDVIERVIDYMEAL